MDEAEGELYQLNTALGAVGYPSIEALKRFFDNIEEVACELPGIKGKCWVWKGPTDKKGYGRFSYRDKAQGISIFWAHRFAFFLKYGILVPELQVHHICHVKGCVYHGHLGDETLLTNAREANAFLRNRRMGYYNQSQLLLEIKEDPNGKEHKSVHAHSITLGELKLLLKRQKAAAEKARTVGGVAQEDPINVNGASVATSGEFGWNGQTHLSREKLERQLGREIMKRGGVVSGRNGNNVNGHEVEQRTQEPDEQSDHPGLKENQTAEPVCDDIPF
jgi:hypothetical protein